MARHDLSTHTDTQFGPSETCPFIDTLIRTGLRRVFPLPIQGAAADHEFRRLLAVMAQRSGGTRPALGPFAAAST
jgi:hypothetical protein